MPELPETLATLLSLSGPSGDEAPVADWLQNVAVPQAAPTTATTVRLLDNLLVVEVGRGERARPL